MKSQNVGDDVPLAINETKNKLDPKRTISVYGHLLSCTFIV